MSIQKRIKKLALYCYHIKSAYKEARKRLKTHKEQYRDILRSVKDTIKSIVILKSVGEDVQKETLKYIEGIVSKALLDVFGKEAYGFKIELTPTKKSMQVNFLFTRAGEDYDPLDCCGYGSVDVACFALRVALFSLCTPEGASRVMIFDEPFKNASAIYRKRIAQLVKKVSDEMNIQFIIVTHFTEMTEFGDNTITVNTEGIRCERCG